MAIDRETVLRYAKLAKLELTEDEIPGMCTDLTAILDYVAAISEVPLTEEDNATTHVFTHEPPLRADEARPGIGAEPALANAPDTEGGHFLVPKVIKVK